MCSLLPNRYILYNPQCTFDTTLQPRTLCPIIGVEADEVTRMMDSMWRKYNLDADSVSTLKRFVETTRQAMTHLRQPLALLHGPASGAAGVASTHRNQ